MEGITISGLEAVEYFKSLPVPEGKAELHERAIRRIKYEVAKDYGTKLKVIPAPKPGWHEVKNCGHCGCECAEVWFEYCPKCGYKILKNPYTEKIMKEYEDKTGEKIKEW